ncbi:MAG: tRNA lysidine(34) synthetase TilS [Gammaproteobacteria bacterium]
MADFTSEQLIEVLRRFPPTGRYLLAISGGVDSMVLLHALVALPHAQRKVSAIHINHGLSPDSQARAGLCQRVCARLAVQITVLAIDARPPPGESPEAWARDLRYAALENVMRPGDMILTAHHRDDNCETLLLQLLRGAGPHGLAAMPECRSFDCGWLGRPLLCYSRDQLEIYASRHGLEWIDDASNRDLRYARNFLRQRVMPSLKQRWPGCASTLTRAAKRQAEAAMLLDRLAEGDLRGAVEQPNVLGVAPLKSLEGPRLRNALRFWIRRLQFSLPSEAKLDQIVQTVLGARPDASPCVHWHEAEVRRYRNTVYLLAPSRELGPPSVCTWTPDETLSIAGGTLYAVRALGRGIKASACEGGRLEVRLRRGGERCRPAGHAHHKPLKKLLQEAGIPPWVRKRIPLIFLQGELVAVSGLWVCHPFSAGADESGWDPIWESDQRPLCKARHGP